MLRERLGFKIISFDSLRDEMIKSFSSAVCTWNGSAKHLVQKLSEWPHVQLMIPLQREDPQELASSRKAPLCLHP